MKLRERRLISNVILLTITFLLGGFLLLEGNHDLKFSTFASSANTVQHVQSKSTRMDVNQMYDIRGKRILFAIPSYDLSQFHYLEKMIENMRNLCEAGAHVNIFIFSTVIYSPETIHLLNSRTNCRNPVGELNVKVKIYPPSIKFRLVDFHRVDFYKHLHEYDLFIYSEDDHDIQTRHITAYLAETERLKQTVGLDDFAKYSIGFIRYEMSNKNKRVTFDQYAFKHAGFTTFLNHPKKSQSNTINGSNQEMVSKTSSTLPHPLRYKYVQNLIFPYQGMFMATREQLQLWDRTPCNFKDIRQVHPDASWHREYVANLRLYENFKFPDKNCHVIQLLPLDDSFEDFFFHHMSDKYFSHFEEIRPEFIKKNTMDPLSFQIWRMGLMKNDNNGDSYNKKYLDASGQYTGVITERGDVPWREDEPKPDFDQLEEYQKKGTLL